jgi:hypothetical protein
MATKKTTSSRKTSSGSGPKSKRTVRGKMKKTMHEYKHHELKSGRSGKPVKNPKQAIAIGLSEARRSGADIPPNPHQKSRGKKAASKKSSSSRKRATKKSSSSTSKKSSSRKSTGRKSATKKSAARKR